MATESSQKNWKQFLEEMDEISSNISSVPAAEEDVNTAAVAPSEGDNEELLDKLNKIFTPILVMQGIEHDISGSLHEAYAEASVLTEKNLIQFDNATRMSQLISVCALLIAQQKNTEKYQMYQKAAVIRNKMKLEIQKDEYDEALRLAQKYLVKVSTTNNSSVARDAATSLLPETQH